MISAKQRSKYKNRKVTTVTTVAPVIDSRTSLYRKAGGKGLTRHVPRNKFSGKSNGINSIFPPKKFMKLQWIQLEKLVASATQGNFGAELVFRLNDIFSSRLTTGQLNRVQGYDQLSGVYREYKVSNCLINCKVNNPTADGLYVAFQLQGSNEIDQLSGQKIGAADMQKWTMVKPINNTGSQTLHYRRKASIASLDGLTAEQLRVNMSSDYSSNIASKPVKNPFLRMAVASNADTTQKTCDVLVELTYEVQLFNRVTLDASVI